MKYSYKDFVPDASAELSPDARASLQDKVAALEKEVADLKVRLGDLKSDLKSLACDYDGWFRRHISDLADHASKEFAKKRENEVLLTALEKIELDKQIRRAVEEMFHREANELAKVIFEALVAKIQPYALKQR
jgi:hypothetical protein